MGRQVRDLSGLRIGKLTVLSIDPSSERGANKNVKWLCKCDCGNTKTALSGNLTRGYPSSCGCAIVAPNKKYATREDARQAAITRATEWNAANREVCRPRMQEAARRRTCRKKNQACSCCSIFELAAYYAARPKGYEVDHVIPISKGGMHCLKNFQYLTTAENRRKSAKLPMAA